MVLLITQNTFKSKASFIFYKVKNIICLHLKIKKTWISLWKKAKKTFIHL